MLPERLFDFIDEGARANNESMSKAMRDGLVFSLLLAIDAEIQKPEVLNQFKEGSKLPSIRALRTAAQVVARWHFGVEIPGVTFTDD